MKTTAKKPAKVEEGRIYHCTHGTKEQWTVVYGKVWFRYRESQKWRESMHDIDDLEIWLDRGIMISADVSPAPITAKLFAAYDTRSGVVYYETAGESKAKVLRVVKATLPGDRDVKVIPLTVTYTPPMAKPKGAKRK